MNRPRYETAQDLDIEWAISVEWAKQFNAIPRKLPLPRYSIDHGIFRGSKLVAVAEIKDRPGWRTEYATVILGLSKVRELHSYFLMAVPAFFVVRLLGEIQYVAIDERIADWHIEWGGRTDRGDAKDVEPVVHIPRLDFK